MQTPTHDPPTRAILMVQAFLLTLAFVLTGIGISMHQLHKARQARDEAAALATTAQAAADDALAILATAEAQATAAQHLLDQVDRLLATAAPKAGSSAAAAAPGGWKPNMPPADCLRTSIVEHLSPQLMRHLTSYALEHLRTVPAYICHWADLGPSYNLRGFITLGRSWPIEAADHEALHALDFMGGPRPTIEIDNPPPEVLDWSMEQHGRWRPVELWPYLAAWYSYDPRAMPPEIAAAVAHLLE